MQKSVPSTESNQSFPTLPFFLSSNRIWVHIREKCQRLFTENWQKQLHNNHNLPQRHLRHKLTWWLATHSYWWSWDHAPPNTRERVLSFGGYIRMNASAHKKWIKSIPEGRKPWFSINSQVVFALRKHQTTHDSGCLRANPGATCQALCLCNPSLPAQFCRYIQSTPNSNRAKYITQCALWD